MLKTISNFTFVLLFGTIANSSCNNKVISENNNAFVDEHTAQNSLDWAGNYFGVLPCADCEGIETSLTIHEDLSYELTTRYLGKADQTINSQKGIFSWEGNNIKLDGIKPSESSPYYKIEEQRIKLLDLEGKEITGEMATLYILQKTGNPNVESKKWKLVELNGKPIESTAETHFLILDPKSGMAHTKANCNTIKVRYRITNEFVIRFEQGISTLMACPDKTEDEYLKVLNAVDNLSSDGSRLTLNKARMAPLAVFELAE